MAVSKTITANGSKGHHYFSLNVSESRTEGNSSYLSGSFSMGPLQNNWDWYNWGSAISYSVIVGSNEFTGTIPSYNGTSVLYLQTFNNIEIPHNNDGTKTITISFSVSDTTGTNYTCGNASASDTLELTQLHKHPEINTIEVVETGFPDNIVVSDNTLVNLLSVKHFLFPNITLYDNSTLKQVDIYGENFSFTFTGDDFTTDDTLNLACWFSDFNINSSKTKIPVTIKITDSLNGVDSSTIEFGYINYMYPNIVDTQSSVKRNGQLTGKAKLNLLGSFSNIIISGLTNVPKLQYRYYEYGTTPSDTLPYITIPTDAYTIDNNTISIYNWNISNNNAEISDLDKSKAYYFDIILSDSYSDTTSSGSSFKTTLICSKGEWLMAKFKDRVDFQKITINGNEISNNSFCSMCTNFVDRIYTDRTTIEGWTSPINVGDYIADTTNNCLIIKNTSILQLGGLLAGSGYAWARFELTDTTNNEEVSLDYNNGVLYQFGGNGYWASPLPPLVTKLDKTKIYKVKLSIAGYGANYAMNRGFDENGTYMWAKKIL